MTAVPPPDVPCVRVRLVYLNTNGTEAGNRFYLSYAGSAPTAGNCITLAGDVANLWNTNLGPNVHPDYALTEVDVLDIATNTGLSGQWTGSHAGGSAGTMMNTAAAVNVEFNIARRYRGGKPRMFLPPPEWAGMADMSHWTPAFMSAVQTGVTAFFAGIEALAIGSMGTLQHVNLSYYEGFKNLANSSGRERAVPQYRASALHDVVEGYAVKSVIGSQRRRRTATTP